MKCVMSCLMVSILWLGLTASAIGHPHPASDARIAKKSSCEKKPTNYKICAAVCDDVATCKKCCARGLFPDRFDKLCKDRCTSTFKSLVREEDIEDDHIDRAYVNPRLYELRLDSSRS